MSAIIYKTEDNKLAVAVPATVGTSLSALAEKYFSNKDYTVVDNFNIDFEFQDAYEYQKDPETETGEAILNYDKAKEIQKDKWRALRKPILEALDVDFMKALETGNVELQKTIASRKQQLRDITKTPMINNLEDIKATMPNILRTE